jgi:hypothetical protein
MATNSVSHPQADDGSGRRQGTHEYEEARRRAQEVATEARWVLHSPRQAGKSAAASQVAAELILPPGVQRDAGVAHFLRRYHTDPEFHAKVFEAVEAGLAKERDKVLLDAQGRVYLIETEDGLPANNAAAMLEEIRKVRTWEEIEKAALNEKERQEAEERSLICIWCGKVCESPEALEIHEDDCA